LIVGGNIFSKIFCIDFGYSVGSWSDFVPVLNSEASGKYLISGRTCDNASSRVRGSEK